MFVQVIRRWVAVGGALVVAAGVLSAQEKAAAPTPLNAVFDVGGQQYSGTTTFIVSAAGKVTGTMELNNPALVKATLAGQIANGVWKFDYPFTMDNQGTACAGTLTGAAKVNADHTEASGDVTISGTCSADTMTGTFSFSKKKSH